MTIIRRLVWRRDDKCVLTAPLPLYLNVLIYRNLAVQALSCRIVFICMVKYVRNTEMLQRRFPMCVCDASWGIENNTFCHRDNSCSRGLITTVEQQLRENLLPHLFVVFGWERRWARHQGESRAGSDSAFPNPKADCLFMEQFGSLGVW